MTTVQQEQQNVEHETSPVTCLSPVLAPLAGGYVKQAATSGVFLSTGITVGTLKSQRKRHPLTEEAEEVKRESNRNRGKTRVNRWKVTRWTEPGLETVNQTREMWIRR